MNKERLMNAIQEFKNKKIAVVGDVILDRYIYGIVERVNPESPAAPLLKVERKESRLGGAANVAMNLTSLGANVSLYSVLGDDSHGIVIEELCEENKINLFNIKEGSTIVKERAIESEFNKYLMRADDGEVNLDTMKEQSELELLDKLKNTEIDVIVLSDYNKKIFKKDFASKIIEWANEKNIPVIVDPKPKNINSFRNSTLLCPNIKEAREIVGNSGDEKEVAKKLRDKLNSRYMIVTCGKKGMILYDGEKFVNIPTKTKELVDVTGAGDTVTSVIALSLISGLNLEESSHVANHAAGIVIGKQGTSVLNQTELIEDLNNNFD